MRFPVVLTVGAYLFPPAAALAGQPPLSPLLAPLAPKVFSVDVSAAPAAPATRFRPAPRNLAAMVNGLTSDPAQREAFAAILEGVFTAYETGAQQGGFADDLAGALAFYISTGYAVNRGGEVSDGGLATIVKQIQVALDTPQMREARDSEKQLLYESFIMLAGLMAARLQAAAGNEAALKELKPLGAEALKALLKVDASKLTINASGLRLAGADSPAATGNAGLHTLLFTANSPWTRKNGSDGITLELKKEDLYNSAITIVVLTNGLPLAGSLQNTFRRYWAEQVLSLMTGKDNPFVMLRLLSPGIRAAFVQEGMEAKQTKVRWTVTYMLVDGGTKVYPVLILQNGYFSDQQKALDRLTATFRPPGGTSPTKPFATNSELGRNWSTSSSSVTNYVNAYNGSPAGTSIIAYAQDYSMKPNGTYTGAFGGISNNLRIRSRESGTYRLEGDMLTFKPSSGKATKKRFLGIDKPPGAVTPIMLLLNPAYPLTSANIGLYGEKYGVTSK